MRSIVLLASLAVLSEGRTTNEELDESIRPLQGRPSKQSSRKGIAVDSPRLRHFFKSRIDGNHDFSEPRIFNLMAASRGRRSSFVREMSQTPPIPDGVPAPQGVAPMPISEGRRRRSFSISDMSQLPPMPVPVPAPPEVPPMLAKARKRRSPGDMKEKAKEKMDKAKEKGAAGREKVNEAKEKGEEMKTQAEGMKGNMPPGPPGGMPPPPGAPEMPPGAPEMPPGAPEMPPMPSG